MTQRPPYPTFDTRQTIVLGLRGRCPRCGQGHIFAGYLAIADHCDACNMDFGGSDTGDGMAVFVMFVLGAVVVALALWVELRFTPPLWVHAVLWAPFISIGALALMRPMKGVTVALQHRFRSTEEPTKPGGT